jgi:putative membrane protein
MNTALLLAGSVFVSLGAVVHVYFYYLESVSWSKPSSWKRFGIKSAEDAETVRPWAVNQGYYNLFIAIGTLAGVALIALPDLDQAGISIAIFGALIMAGAGVVLVSNNKRMAIGALIQGAAPLVGAALLFASQLT